MTAIDWVIVGFALLMVLWGYAQGLIVGAFSLAGFTGGAFLGARLGPELLSEGSRSPYAPLSALIGALMVGGILAAILETVGFRLRRGLGERLGVLDGLGGAALIGCVALAAAWLFGAVALQTPGARELRGDIQRSKILGALNEALPPSGPILNALARFDPFPEFEGPEAEVRPPSRGIARDPDVKAAAASVVRVLGTACGLGVQGSGWVAGDGVVVTNAHVVGGQDDTTVEVRGTGPGHDADVVVFDPRNDLAVLRSPGVAGTPALPLRTGARRGTSAAVLGFPENGPYTVRPARVGNTSVVVSRDAYGRGPLRRRVTVLRGRVRSGNSGGPAVDSRGRVVTTVFAAGVGAGSSTGYGIPASITARALRRAGGAPVDTGPCTR